MQKGKVKGPSSFPSCNLPFCNPAMSTSTPASEIIEGPVEGRVRELERVLLDELFFRRQQPGHDERDHRAFDGASADERRRGLVGIGVRELFRAPRKDGARPDLSRISIDRDALGAGDALRRGFGKLLFEPRGGEGFAPQPSAADRAPISAAALDRKSVV